MMYTDASYDAKQSAIVTAVVSGGICLDENPDTATIYCRFWRNEYLAQPLPPMMLHASSVLGPNLPIFRRSFVRSSSEALTRSLTISQHIPMVSGFQTRFQLQGHISLRSRRARSLRLPFDYPAPKRENDVIASWRHKSAMNLY